MACRFFAVGALVSQIRGGKGAVATQAFVSPIRGGGGRAPAGAGEAADAVLADLVARDGGQAQRQIHMVDAEGRPAPIPARTASAGAGT